MPVLRLVGGVAGLLAGAAAVAVAEAATALLEGVTSPLLAVANRAVDAAPRPVKEWAIETFGSADKAVLIAGVVATVAGLAFLAGVVGATRRRPAVGAFLGLSAVAAAAALTDRAATASPPARLVPVVVLVATGLLALLAPAADPAALSLISGPGRPAPSGRPGPVRWRPSSSASPGCGCPATWPATTCLPRSTGGPSSRRR